jgi:hypothetical protein
MDREPLFSVATVTAVLTAAFAALVSFGFDISDDRQSALLGLTAVAVPLITAIWARGKVTPVAAPRSADGRALVVTSLPEPPVENA